MAEAINIAGPGCGIAITVLGYERDGRAGADPEWLTCIVECSVGPFRGTLRVPLATEDLARLEESLTRALDGSATRAGLDTIEGRVTISIDVGSRGDATVSGNLRYESGPEAVLGFKFESDQSYLRGTLAEVGRALATFPLREARGRDRAGGKTGDIHDR